jgi:hypothetical protein
VKKRRKFWVPRRTPEGVERAPLEILDAPGKLKLPPMPIMAPNANGIYEVIWAPPRQPLPDPVDSDGAGGKS